MHKVYTSRGSLWHSNVSNIGMRNSRFSLYCCVVHVIMMQISTFQNIPSVTFYLYIAECLFCTVNVDFTYHNKSFVSAHALTLLKCVWMTEDLLYMYYNSACCYNWIKLSHHTFNFVLLEYNMEFNKSQVLYTYHGDTVHTTGTINSEFFTLQVGSKHSGITWELVAIVSQAMLTVSSHWLPLLNVCSLGIRTPTKCQLYCVCVFLSYYYMLQFPLFQIGKTHSMPDSISLATLTDDDFM